MAITAVCSKSGGSFVASSLVFAAPMCVEYVWFRFCSTVLCAM